MRKENGICVVAAANAVAAFVVDVVIVRDVIPISNLRRILNI